MRVPPRSQHRFHTIVSNHLSFMDILVYMAVCFPSFVAKVPVAVLCPRGSRDLTRDSPWDRWDVPCRCRRMQAGVLQVPLVGRLSRSFQCLYVSKHTDPTAPSATQAIGKRQQDMHDFPDSACELPATLQCAALVLTSLATHRVLCGRGWVLHSVRAAPNLRRGHHHQRHLRRYGTAQHGTAQNREWTVVSQPCCVLIWVLPPRPCLSDCAGRFRTGTFRAGHSVQPAVIKCVAR